MAESAFKKYKTRDPYKIVEARNILLKDFSMPENLLGFFTVSNRRQVIGINCAADPVQRLTGIVHELGHSLNDYKAAASGNKFQDSFEDVQFFSLSNAPSEFNANLTGAELFIPDDSILDRISYESYVRLVKYINSHIDHYRTNRAKMQFEAEAIQDFYDEHTEIPSFEGLACELGIDVGLVKFKFKALEYKGYDLPNIPETQSDFLKNWQRRPEF